ncbi:hypothetical protein BDN72DRAFT_93291 [Pluteus cervinus]|uniref:Uncharacterized protein n=1 Tax=Pluteus cervinus TaxID=181527 RepID=A0ACD3APA6_9AGAR|nr:hypothetical protein BDN72DRAFT_93291 [Pluteus cervinus]
MGGRSVSLHPKDTLELVRGGLQSEMSESRWWGRWWWWWWWLMLKLSADERLLYTHLRRWHKDIPKEFKTRH